MKSSFGRYCGRLLATASVVAVVVMGTPMLEGMGTVAAQTKTTNAKKKGTASGTQKKTSGSKTNSPQKKSAGTQKQSSSARKGSASQSQKKPSSGGKGQSTQGKKQPASGRNSAKAPTEPKSSAEAKKLQEETQRDIRHTKEKLRLNEAEIKTGLADLSRLSSEIATGRNQVAGLQKKVAGLNGQITNLGKEIIKNEAELKLMREEYLKAVKKMRLTKKNQSTLAFIFASENFNQAMRRIRYMRQFSAWKERKSADIDGKIEQLGKERESLAKAKDAQTVALGQLTKSQATLEENHKKQQALVATLRQNGDALQAHLMAKQLEANRLKETITSLIAQEQAKAEAERRAREKAEAERKAKAEAERIAREKAEAERKAAEERAAVEKAAADKAAAEKALAEKVAAEKAAAERAAAEKAAAERAAAKALAEKQAAEKALAEKAAAEKKAAEKAAAEKAAAEKAAAEKEAREKAEAYKKAQEEKERADRKFAEAKAKAEEKLRKEQEKQDKKDFKESKRTARKKGDRLKNSVEVRNKAKSKDAVAVATPKTVEKTVVKETAAKVNFASLRGQLPRPVDGSWRITNAFGRHAMPEMPEIEYDNPGIDAEVAKGTTVKAVCGGKVSGVYKLSGYGNVVIVNHGDYYTVYGNLGSTNVSVGTQVGKGSALGTAGSDPDDPRRGSVHFEVWKGREKQNPSSWLR